MISRFDGRFWFLSNFYPVQVEWDGAIYPSVEHAFQAAKTEDGFAREAIRNAPTPAKAKRLGRCVALRPGWNEMRLSVMEDLLRQKFEPGTALAAKLLSTGNEDLVEGNPWGDVWWGVCRGIGQNHLGRLLMQIRAELALPL